MWLIQLLLCFPRGINLKASGTRRALSSLGRKAARSTLGSEAGASGSWALFPAVDAMSLQSKWHCMSCWAMLQKKFILFFQNTVLISIAPPEGNLGVLLSMWISCAVEAWQDSLLWCCVLEPSLLCCVRTRRAGAFLARSTRGQAPVGTHWWSPVWPPAGAARLCNGCSAAS